MAPAPSTAATAFFWTTTCTIVDLIPNSKLAFRVNANGTMGTHELEPSGDTTRAIESRHAENGVSSFERELVAGMNASLAKIKAAAESG